MNKMMEKIGRVQVESVQMWKLRMQAATNRIVQSAMKKEAGVDGILVTVGLCIIALVLCVVMKDSLKSFVETLVTAMTDEAKEVLNGVTP